MKRTTYLTFCLLLLLAACEDDFRSDGFRMERQPYFLALTSDSVEAVAGGGDFRFSVDVDPDWHWRVVCSDAWITAMPAAGTGPAAVKVSLSPSTAVEGRSGAIEVVLEPNPAIVQAIRIRQGTYAVDLGLSVLWSSCNVGARYEGEAGGFFRWGETFPAQGDWSEAGYWNHPGYGVERIAGNPQRDAATANMDSGWRMPTQAEVDELFARCAITWEPGGYRFTGPSGASIVFPMAGVYLGGGYYSDPRPMLWCGEAEGRYAHFYCIPDISCRSTHGFAAAMNVRGVAIAASSGN